MTKRYICVKGSPEIPKGSMVEKEGLSYALYIQNTQYTTPKGTTVNLEPWQVESNECWEEVKEETVSPAPVKRWKPKVGEHYYFLDESGFVDQNEWGGTLGDERMWELGNCFQTEQEARDEVKRRESIANAWRPTGQEKVYWVWLFLSKKPLMVTAEEHYLPEEYIGAIHPTEEACKQWGETDAHLFLPKTV